MSHLHFQGKAVSEHLREARQKGFAVSSELHGLEISGFWVALTDSGKEAALFSALVTLVFHFAGIPLLTAVKALLLLFLPFALWRSVRSLLLGYARMQRLHKLIEEERYEIEHNREQEKEEMLEMYQSKGLEEPLLSQVIDILMADQNRLLEIMLTEELGLKVECMEHPLRQAIGAFLGTLVVFAINIAAGFFLALPYLIGANLLIVFGLSLLAAKKLGIEQIFSSLWFLSLSITTFLIVYFLSQKIYL